MQPPISREISDRFRKGSRGSLEPPSGAKSSHFHGEFQEILCEIRQTNPPFLHLNPLLRNPESAPEMLSVALSTFKSVGLGVGLRDYAGIKIR